MTEPCADCPFLKKNAKSYGARRLREFADQNFHCHKTGICTEDEETGGEYLPTEDSLACAGHLIYNEKRERPNQMMRIAERLGMYDRRKLNMTAKVAGLILACLCVSAGVREKKPSETLMDLASGASERHGKPVLALPPASIIPLPMPAPSRPITRAVVIRPGITNVSVSWTCSTNWITENTTAGGTVVYDTNAQTPRRPFTNSYATLDVRAYLTNCLRTGLADSTGPVTNMTYAQSNRVTLLISKPFQQFRAFVGPAKQ